MQKELSAILGSTVLSTHNYQKTNVLESFYSGENNFVTELYEKCQ